MNHSWKIFAISLRRVRERREQVLKQLLPLGLPFELVDAVDGQEIKPELLAREQDADEMPVGAIACYQSHIGVLERIVDYGLDYGLILEDDFVLGSAPTLTLANLWERIPHGADHIQLHMLKDFMSYEYAVEEEGEWFNRLSCTNICCAGYVVSHRLASYILKLHRTPKVPIDILYIQISKLRTFNFYDVREKLIELNWNLASCINPPRGGPAAPVRRPRVLCYTLALDMKEVKCYRQQARMMVASLKRSGFGGDIKIIHNGETEIFDHPNPAVEEIRIDAPASTTACCQLKYKAHELFSVEGYDWVLFLDTDFIVSTSLDRWFCGPEIIRYATEPAFMIQESQFSALLTDDEMETLSRPGVNAGIFVVKAENFHEVMERWERIEAEGSSSRDIHDQHAWNRLLLDTGLSSKLLEDPEVKYFYHNAQV
ncbi:MAG: glycosyltransferase family 25 protein, partial [Verrucomicrobiaceae bacterium]